MLLLHTVAMQLVRKSIASAGAERQAQFSVTSSQPEGSARPMGTMQLKRQLGAEATTGRAVMEYGGELSVEVVIAAEPVIDMDIDIDIDIESEVDDAARARQLRFKRKNAWSFIVAKEHMASSAKWNSDVRRAGRNTPFLLSLPLQVLEEQRN